MSGNTEDSLWNGMFLWRALCACLTMLLSAATVAMPQSSASFIRRGQIEVAGEYREFIVRHLPPSSFPMLPARIAAELERRGCTIPQTYEAHRPENVIHASLERPGSDDWAVLCSSDGTVALLVFFASGGKPITLATAQETERLQSLGKNRILEFDWGIDPATPEVVHQAQAGLSPRPAKLDHDALADVSVERKTIYHFYAHGVWTRVELP